MSNRLSNRLAGWFRIATLVSIPASLSIIAAPNSLGKRTELPVIGRRSAGGFSGRLVAARGRFQRSGPRPRGTTSEDRRAGAQDAPTAPLTPSPHFAPVGCTTADVPPKGGLTARPPAVPAMATCFFQGGLDVFHTVRPFLEVFEEVARSDMVGRQVQEFSNG